MAKEQIKVGDAVCFYTSGTQPMKHGQVVDILDTDPVKCEVMVYSEGKAYLVLMSRLKKE